MTKAHQGISAQKMQELRAMLTGVYGLRTLLERFARELPPASPNAARTILHSRVACVLHDRINLAIQDLEAAIAEVERET
jgi:hypothetical protein